MHVGIETTQNVEIKYEIASLGDRLMAAIIDYLIIAGYVAGLIVLFIAAPGLFSTVVAVVCYAPILFYDLLFEVLMDGQSPGKRQRQIKVVKLDGTQPDFGSYVLRWLIRLFEASLIFFGGTPAIITILVNGKGQRLGDMAAGTTVVKVQATVTLEDTIYSAVAEDYIPVFPQAQRMSDRDASIVREVLNARTHRGDGVAAALLSLRVRELFDIQTEMPPVEFLETLLRDYNHYMSQ